MQPRVFHFRYPTAVKPAWSHLVDRWYQLDAASYGLCEAYQTWFGDQTLENPPQRILMVSPSASNEADFEFVRAGAASPSKFAYTLPNVRVSPLCQVMRWSGPVICIQNGEESLATALAEANASTIQPVWIFHFIRTSPFESAANETHDYQVQLF